MVISMSYYYNYYGRANMHYRKVDEKKQLGDAYIKRMLKKGYDIQPVSVIATGRKVTTTWWGKAWCDNLEKYADEENRISRGKTYLKDGFVLDLHIDKGEVTAIVQGNRKKPYEVEIDIAPLSKRRIDEILTNCGKKLDSLDMLVSGQFPKDLKELFTSDEGLFPKLSEIRFYCDCPDSAYMCKHVAAVLYGIGVRMDEDPLLFFKLRGIDVNNFIDKTIKSKVNTLLDNASKKSDRIIKDSDIDKLFGL